MGIGSVTARSWGDCQMRAVVSDARHGAEKRKCSYEVEEAGRAVPMPAHQKAVLLQLRLKE